MTKTVAAFYQFLPVTDPAALRHALLPHAERLALKGTIILAPEGINATIAGQAEAITEFMGLLQTGAAAPPAFAALELKFSTAPAMPFARLKLRLKREIVTIGDPAADPTRTVGTYIAPQDWNALLDDPETLLIDTRNSFEIAQGSFPGAINPGTRSFGDFPAFVDQALSPQRHRRIAMFCTGGIRCEKATALLLHRGFTDVVHLKGGILAYLEHVPAAESRWQGHCFVFDERKALGPGLIAVSGSTDS